MKKYTFNAENFNMFEEAFELIQYLKQTYPTLASIHLENYLKNAFLGCDVELKNLNAFLGYDAELKNLNALKIMLVFEEIFKSDNSQFPSKLHQEKRSSDNLQSLLIQHYSVSFEQIENAFNNLCYAIDINYLLHEGILIEVNTFVLNSNEINLVQGLLNNGVINNFGEVDKQIALGILDKFKV